MAEFEDKVATGELASKYAMEVVKGEEQINRNDNEFVILNCQQPWKGDVVDSKFRSSMGPYFNEPTRHQQYTVAWVYNHSKAQSGVPRIELYTTCVVPRRAELTVSYGPAYERHYEIPSLENATPPLRHDINWVNGRGEWRQANWMWNGPVLKNNTGKYTALGRKHRSIYPVNSGGFLEDDPILSNMRRSILADLGPDNG